MQNSTFKIALICGGPSPERGISLNSARSVMDHLSNDNITIIPLYVDYVRQFYLLSTGQLYSNTPADFDFKLQQTAELLSASALLEVLRAVDLVFPLIHGSFGEDGELQSFLEEHAIPFIGNSAECCRNMFNKDWAAAILQQNGFPTLPQLVINYSQNKQTTLIESFFTSHSLKRAVVKPAYGGSSIGVASVSTPSEAMQQTCFIFNNGLATRAIIESFCQGREFTIVIFENHLGEPVALIPTEIELSYDNHQLFDFRKKYLPSHQAIYHTPPRFDRAIIKQIRRQATEIFKIFAMRDFVRIDGWVTTNNEICFTDFNPISGLEQNSFLFQQAASLGMTHHTALAYILQNACQRYNLTFPVKATQKSASKKPVYVVFGGANAERQVSLMSGTNVWLKLLQSHSFTPIPYFIDQNNDLWQLPYGYCLHHTVEEIYTNCIAVKSHPDAMLIDTINQELGIDQKKSIDPFSISVADFLQHAQQNKAFVFLALHGGDGENGVWQRQLEEHKIPFNGSGGEVSALCMDKYATGEKINQLNSSWMTSLPKFKISLEVLLKAVNSLPCAQLWEKASLKLSSEHLIIKPCNDGCSAGIALLQNAADLKVYVTYLSQKVSHIPANTFVGQSMPIEMPTSNIDAYLLEPFIESDLLVIKENSLHHTPKNGWIELTVGVLEKQGNYLALHPSITVAEGSVLSLEEKFQGGTGVNLTPPPRTILSAQLNDKIREGVAHMARHLGIENYARLDVFFNCHSHKLILIEANTLPGLTPSTVIFHQGLAQEPPLTPVQLLENIINTRLL